MPGRLDNAPYLSTGDPKTSVGATLFREGELGHVYNAPNGYRWQLVKFEGTLTQAAVASNLVYWKDASTMSATTDLTDSQGSRNTVAGVLHASATMPTANQYAWILQEGDSVTLNGTTVNFIAGGKIVASSTVGVVTVTAQATAAVDNPIGTVHTAVDRSGGAGTVVCDINIPSRLY